MDLKDFIRVVRKGWLGLLVCGLVSVGLGSSYLLTAERQYTATTELFVSVKSVVESAGEVVQGSSAAQLKVKSYVEVVRSAKVLDPVIEQLGLDETSESLAARVTTAVPQNTVLLEVSVSDPDPATAAKIANTIGSSTRAVVEDLETTTDGSLSPVTVQTIEPATAPSTPSSPRPLVTYGLVLTLGLASGFVFMVLRDRLDTRVRGKSDIESTTHVPVIGSIGFDPKSVERPLVVRDDARSPRAESFRALRTNLQFLDPSNTDRTFVLTSALPSEGKTTTSANLAIAIAESGASVALVDADLRRPRLAEVMGVEGAAGLTDVLVGRAELDDVLQPWGEHALAVLPAGGVPPNPSELLGSTGMQALIDELAERFQYVIVDAPPLLPVTDAAILSRFVRGALLVSSVRRSRRGHFREAIHSLERIDREPLGIVLTMLPPSGPDGYGYGEHAHYYGRDADPQRQKPALGRRRVRAPEGPTAADPDH